MTTPGARPPSPPVATTHPAAGAETPTYAKQLGERLRALRRHQGRSLHQVEAQSHGEWKVAALGSYERGDRMISMDRLARLAAFYGVPVNVLLPGRPVGDRAARGVRIVLDLPALAQVSDPNVERLRRWVAQIQVARHDYGGRVLTIRTEDRRTLAVLYDVAPDTLTAHLQRWRVLHATSNLPNPTDPTDPR
ncbi:transcriptional regulator [Frankia sp. AgB1.9]|uniref:transcriptional regulator n=1 Tax=unclassified Frankia TaxID=2632575 RepID=UPI001931B599|nr:MULTISPECIES: transcriptional regulator [unclassified Frankia]MBL7489048.1 transcriptional regulator [Frankia sp. AgW1.1]MBL7554106.1 transcriptional regulator [Frankia sp. AgB1.9]